MQNIYDMFGGDADYGGSDLGAEPAPMPAPAPAPLYIPPTIYTPPPVYEPPASEQPAPVYEPPAPVYEPPTPEPAGIAALLGSITTPMMGFSSEYNDADYGGSDLMPVTPAPAPAPVPAPVYEPPASEQSAPIPIPDTNSWFVDPNAGWNYNTETMEGPPASLGALNLANLIAPKAAELGWVGGLPITEDPNTGGSSLNPAFGQFLQDAGLKLSGEPSGLNGMAGVTSFLTDTSGNRVAENSYYERPDPLLDMLAALGPVLVTGGAGGAFGPGFAASAGITNPILAAGVNAAATQALTTGSIDPAGILTNMATSYITPTINQAVSNVMPDLSSTIGSTANAAVTRAAQDAALAALKGGDISNAVLASLGGSAVGAAAPELGLTDKQLGAVVNLASQGVNPGTIMGLISAGVPKSASPSTAALDPSQIDTMYDQQSLDNLMNGPENTLPPEIISEPMPAPAPEPAFDFNQWMQEQEAALPPELAPQQVEVTAPAPTAAPAYDYDYLADPQQDAPAPQDAFSQWVQEQEAALPPEAAEQQVEITAPTPEEDYSRPDYQIPEPPAIDWTTPTDNFTGPTPEELAAITPAIPNLPAPVKLPIKPSAPAPAPAAQQSSMSPLDILAVVGMMGGNAAEPRQELFSGPGFDASSFGKDKLDIPRSADIFALLNAMNSRG